MRQACEQLRGGRFVVRVNCENTFRRFYQAEGVCELFNRWIVASIQGERAALLGDFVNEVLDGLFARLCIGCERGLLDFWDTAQSLYKFVHGLFRHSGFFGHLLKAVCPLIGLCLGFFLAVGGFFKRPSFILDRLNLGSHTVDKPAV